MGKRKERQPKTLINNQSESHDNDSQQDEEDKAGGFFACYLLTSLCPRYKGHTYIGFTVNPRRRIRQHNGELCSGATRTKKKRPWEMVLCIHGFPSNVAALQFEWAWQHPVESLAVRKAAVGFKSLGGLANKIKLAYTMLTLPAWNNLNLTVNFFSTKYTNHYAGCPTLPSHMRVHIRSMDELPCYTEGYEEGEDEMFKFDNDSWDEEEPEKTGGPGDLEVPDEDVDVTPINQEAFFEPPSHFNDMWNDDKEPEETGGSYNIGEGLDDIKKPILVSEDVKNNEEQAICVSDDENYERPSCSKNNSPGSLIVKIPESSFTGSDYCSLVSPTMEDEFGTINCAEHEDKTRTKIAGSSHQVEVIDILSPSPEYRISSRRKKRGVSVVCPDIIDLTESPICV